MKKTLVSLALFGALSLPFLVQASFLDDIVEDKLFALQAQFEEIQARFDELVDSLLAQAIIPTYRPRPLLVGDFNRNGEVVKEEVFLAESIFNKQVSSTADQLTILDVNRNKLVDSEEWEAVKRNIFGYPKACHYTTSFASRNTFFLGDLNVDGRVLETEINEIKRESQGENRLTTARSFMIADGNVNAFIDEDDVDFAKTNLDLPSRQLLNCVATRPTLRLLWPRGGEILEEGKRYSIRWDYYGVSSSLGVKNSLLLLAAQPDGSFESKQVMQNIPISRRYHIWTASGTQAVNNQYKFQVASVLGGKVVSDISPRPFTINPKVVSVTTSSLLAVSRNQSVGTPTATKGMIGAKIGSYVLTANTSQGVNLSSVSIKMGNRAELFQNLRFMVDGAQFGTASVLFTNRIYTFSTPIHVPAGQSKVVDIYADVLSSATPGTYSTLTTLASCSGSGAASSVSVGCPTVSGQNLIVGGQSVVVISTNNGMTPPSGQLVMGSVDNSLGAWTFTETSGLEDVKINDLTIFQSVANTSKVKSSFVNLSLWSAGAISPGASAIAGVPQVSTSLKTPSPGYYYKFNFANPIIVPKSGSVVVLLKGDIASFSSSGATDNATHVFKIATSTDADNNTLPETVVALGRTSNTTSALIFSGGTAPAANTQTVLRTRLYVSAQGLGSTSGRVKSSADDLGTITFTADSAGTAVLNTLTLTFSGTAPTKAAFLHSVDLLDAGGSNVTSSLSGVKVSMSTNCTGTTTCTKSWNFGVGKNGFPIGAGASYTFRVRLNSISGTQIAASGAAVSLGVAINSTAHVTFTTGVDANSTVNVNLPPTAVPIIIQNVTYSQGT